MSEKSRSIKMWATEDRPREKLINKGQEALTSAELLAILIGSGSNKESALVLAQNILSKSNGLQDLGSQGLEFFTSFDGIGKAKATTIIAALELGRRRSITPPSSKAKIKSSRDAYNLFGPVLSDLQHEEFWIACLNRGNQVIARERISSGGISATVVDPKILFYRTLVKSAASIILFHNHPSGNIQPSKEDVRLTNKIVDAGKLLEINVLDHIIVAKGRYLSFADEGLL